MSDLRTTRLIDLLPPNLRKNPDLLAAAAAIDQGFFDVVDTVAYTLILADVDNLPEPMLDHLMWQFHITFEEGAGLAETVEEKRRFVKNALRIHKLKGTKRALEMAIELLDMRGIITEWFEYGGDPYHFRIDLLEVTTKGLSEEIILLLEKLINAYKNRRSWLEAINVFLTGRGKMYIASAMQAGEEITVYPWQETTIETKGTARLGSVSQSVETLTVYPE